MENWDLAYREAVTASKKAKRQKEGQDMQIILEEIRDEILKRFQRPESNTEKFITNNSLLEVWEWELKGFVSSTNLGFEANEQLTFLKDNLLKTISILVYIKWKEWSRFREIFMENQEFRHDRLDTKMPYELGCLRDESFLGKSDGTDFFDLQPLFLPITLKQGEILEAKKWERLPLKTGEEGLGKGSFGKVTKEIIPSGHLILKHQNKETYPTDDYPVARKVLLVKKDYIIERQNLKNLRESLTKHDHIVMNIAAVAIGNEYNLFFDIAKTDLHEFLYGLNDTDQIDLKTLIGEASNVADALRFLHDELSPDRGGGDTTRKACHHADLKPDNILVYERTPKDIVGRWKITDFGISTIGTLSEEESAGSNISPANNRTIMAKRRARGLYTAPETRSGRRSDIWSFGCIFHQVLAAGIGGKSLLDELDERRADTEDDGTIIASSNFYREEGGRLELKPCVVHWVKDELPAYRGTSSRPINSVLTRECSNLIMAMLKIEKNDRLHARDVRRRLGEILDGNLGSRATSTPSASNRGSVSTQAGQGSISTGTTLIPSKSHGSSVSTQAERGSNSSGTTPSERESTYTPPLSPTLVLAIKKKNAPVVRRQLEKGVDISAQESDGYCALHLAVRVGSKSVFRELLNSEQVKQVKQVKGHNIRGIDAPDRTGATALHHAASLGNMEFAIELIGKNADKDARDDYGRSPLYMAVDGSHESFVEWLLNEGAKITPNLPPRFKDYQNTLELRKRKREKEAKKKSRKFW